MTYSAVCASRKPRNDSADGNYTSFLVLSSDAHFSHDTPLHPDLDLPFASRTEVGEPGSAPPNRRASAVGWKTPKTDPSGSLVWSGCPAFGETGAGRWPSSNQKRSLPG